MQRRGIVIGAQKPDRRHLPGGLIINQIDAEDLAIIEGLGDADRLAGQAGLGAEFTAVGRNGDREHIGHRPGTEHDIDAGIELHVRAGNRHRGMGRSGERNNKGCSSHEHGETRTKRHGLILPGRRLSGGERKHRQKAVRTGPERHTVRVSQICSFAARPHPSGADTG